MIVCEMVGRSRSVWLLLLACGCHTRSGGDAALIYAQVAPAIAYVESPTAAGSAVLLSDGHLVTNAHVVWPFTQVRVVFPDGSEFPHAPVQAMDALTDLALLGPLPRRSELALDVSSLVPVGSRVYLLGYPGEAESFPQPAITQGLLSRVRRAGFLGLTYLQTDAMIGAGQSGGALLSDAGKLIGISGLGEFGEAGFALVASAPDVAAVVRDLSAPRRQRTLQREIPLGGGSKEHKITLSDYWDERLFVAHVPSPDFDWRLRLDGDASVSVYGPDGDLIAPDDVTTAGPHFVVVFQHGNGRKTARLRSNLELIPYADPDDGHVLAVGELYRGVMDYAADDDRLLLPLTRGQSVTIRADGLFDPRLYVAPPDGDSESLAFNDDGGGGLYDKARSSISWPHTAARSSSGSTTATTTLPAATSSASCLRPERYAASCSVRLTAGLRSFQICASTR
jgi:hypothetical protein